MEIYIRHFKNKKERNEAIKCASIILLCLIGFVSLLAFLFFLLD